MCLLVVIFQIYEDVPLVVAAVRDEVLDRPAVAMDVLRKHEPRVIGGRDLAAQGTWMAITSSGLIAGLTNMPARGELNLMLRSRGELPMLATASPDAEQAIDALRESIRPSDYRPSWLCVADRKCLFLVDATGGEHIAVMKLGPGVHVFENQPPGVMSARGRGVRTLLEEAQVGVRREGLEDRLQLVLADHQIPEESRSLPDRMGSLFAPCVHADGYGSRWSAIITVRSEPDALPDVRYTDGPACRLEWRNAWSFWDR